MRILGLVLLILALTFYSLLDTSGQMASSDESVKAQNMPIWNEPNLSHLKTLSPTDILNRPLFEAQRRGSQINQASSLAPPQVKLVAVSISEDTKIAIVKELKSDRTFYLKEGDKLESWIVQQVDPVKITLTQMQEKTIIPLFDDN